MKPTCVQCRHDKTLEQLELKQSEIGGKSTTRNITVSQRKQKGKIEKYNRQLTS